MTSEFTACVECGNDDPTEGYDVCLDCLTGELPEDWHVGWCEYCLTSLLWTPTEANTYEGMAHADTILWAWVQAHPEPCSPPADDAPGAEEQPVAGRG